MKSKAMTADCLEWMRDQPSDSVDLVFTSPPYEDARTYGIDFNLKGQAWVDWCVERFVECVRICRGMVCWNVEGRTRKFRWSAVPAMLMADLHRAGVHLRKPPIMHRVGIPGSGGPDWWRNDYEFIICGSKGGKLAWSDNTATGHKPKWAPGGAMSNRLEDGSRVNQWGTSFDKGGPTTSPDGQVKRNTRKPSHRLVTRDKWGSTGHASGMQGRKTNGSFKTRNGKDKLAAGAKLHTKAEANGDMREQAYLPPVLANPGNVLAIKVGGGLMGSKHAHDNEAPFAEAIVEPFVLCYCPPGGIVLDPFSGSGTTICVAERLGRVGIGIDIRQSQTDLATRRLATVQKELLCG